MIKLRVFALEGLALLANRMARNVDLSGTHCGLLTVIEKSSEKYGAQTQWVCLCVCGKQKLVTTGNLNAKKVISCGCQRNNGAFKSDDLSGQKFGRLSVVSKTEKRSSGSVVWLCHCDCGKMKEVRQNRLKSGTTKSCGCLNIEAINKINSLPPENLLGRKFNRLTVVASAPKRLADGSAMWKCVCECGKQSVVRADALLRGTIKSCGCLTKEMIKLRSGIKHHNYNPLLTDEEREKNRYQLFGKNLASWRKEVFMNDNYSCVSCGVISGSLNAHHLDSWDWCIEKRFDVTNGKTLCVQCHSSFHKKYGYGKNTSCQFMKFLKKDDDIEAGERNGGFGSTNTP